MKNFLFFVGILILSCSIAVAQSKEVSLVVTGEGETKDIAIQNALRNAIEQTCGVFLASNTAILNEEIMSEEIISTSSGSIKSYQEISSIEISSGIKVVSLQVIVSVGELIQYAQNHGSEVSFSGELFEMNLRQYELNKLNTEKALSSLDEMATLLAPGIFDYKIEMLNSRVVENYIEHHCRVNVYTNDNTSRFLDFLMGSLAALSVGQKEAKTVMATGVSMYSYRIGLAPISELLYIAEVDAEKYWFYAPVQANKIAAAISKALTNFVVEDNNGTKYKFSLSPIPDLVRENSYEGLYETGKEISFYLKGLAGSKVASFSKTIQMSRDKNQSFSNLRVSPLSDISSLNYSVPGNYSKKKTARRITIVGLNYLSHHGFGAMVGTCKNIGGFVQLNGLKKSEWAGADSNLWVEYSSFSLVGGGMTRITGGLFPFVGGGYSFGSTDLTVKGSSLNSSANSISEDVKKRMSKFTPGFIVETGIIFNLAYFGCMLGISYGQHSGIGMDLGIGFRF